MQFGPFLDGYHDVESQLIDYLRRKAEEAIARRDCEKSNLNSIEDCQRYRQKVREHFLKVIGGLPTSKCELEPQITGVIQGEGYRIEKVIFQSLPGFFVTSNLYLPEGEGPVPGILFACGHSRDAKAYPVYQKVCLDLVANGFAVLAVDPQGQGERLQYWRDGREDVRWGTVEHSYSGIKCSLLGMSIARYFVWDLIRALDYLSSRPEVDSTRLGITGNSGGGTQTSYMMLLDDRLKAAAPCTYITSRKAYLGTGQAHDMEQNTLGAITHGPDHDDFLAAFAPRPAMVGAVDSDFFNVEGAVRSVEKARRVYALYGAEDKLQLEVAPGTHCYHPLLRQAAVNWFRVHLLGLPADFETGDPKTRDPQELYCTESGQVLGDFPEAATIHDIILEELGKVQHKDFTPGLLEKTLGLPKLSGPTYPRVIANNEIADGIKREKIFFWSEPGILVSGLLFTPTEPAEDPVLLLLEDGTAETERSWELIASLLAEKRQVFLFDPRGRGAVSPRVINSIKGQPHHFYETEFRLSCDAQMLGTSLVGLQVADVLRGAEYLRGRAGREKLVLAGRGRGALLAALAAPLTEVSQLRLSQMQPDFAEIVKTRLYPLERVPILFGPLDSWDLPDLYQYLKEREIPIYRQLTAPLGSSL